MRTEMTRSVDDRAPRKNTMSMNLADCCCKLCTPVRVIVSCDCFVSWRPCCLRAIRGGELEYRSFIRRLINNTNISIRQELLRMPWEWVCFIFFSRFHGFSSPHPIYSPFPKASCPTYSWFSWGISSTQLPFFILSLWAQLQDGSVPLFSCCISDVSL